MRFATNAFSAPEGRLFMVVGGGYWGKGETLAEALAAAKSSGMHNQKKFALYLCSPNDVINEHGRFRYSKVNGEPILVGTYNADAS